MFRLLIQGRFRTLPASPAAPRTVVAVVLVCAVGAMASPAWAGAPDDYAGVNASVSIGFNSQTPTSPASDMAGWKQGQTQDLAAHQDYVTSATVGVTAAAHTDLAAHWNSGPSGTIAEHTSWDIHDASTSAAIDFTDINNASAPTAWTYGFHNDAASVLTIDSSLTGVGDLAGLGRWLVVVDVAGAQDPMFLTLTSGFQPGLNSASGSVSINLSGGTDYVISLINADWISLAPGAFAPGPFSSIRNDVTGSEAGLFSWSIAAGAPEPSGWALAILGFGMIGVAQRRRALAA